MQASISIPDSHFPDCSPTYITRSLIELHRAPRIAYRLFRLSLISLIAFAYLASSLSVHFVISDIEIKECRGRGTGHWSIPSKYREAW